MVTQQPVVTGEPFQVQYVLEDFNENNEFYPPDFKNFRFVSGPFVHEGSAYGADGIKKVKNVVYTLEAVKPGKFIIEGATAKVEDRLLKSDNVLIEVISKAEAFKKGLLYDKPQTNTSFYLKPGENPYEKIRNNLFLRVVTDKKTCFVGEPVTATFKLYSRLESKSDIVKNPAFYGFTVQDMIGLNDKLVANETINGKIFDVHTVRKVQLYPLQAGTFFIDAMEVENKVEFSKSIVNKKTEQEVIEGVLSDNEPFKESMNTETYENSMRTEPISITVKPVPQKNKPAGFAGATGRFSISSIVNKNTIEKNEEGEFIVTISGKGNFTQLTAPAIQWPEGIEGFEPQIKDSLDNGFSPLRGSRAFYFHFVSAKAATYNLPAIDLSFFDPDSNSYKTVSTKIIQIAVAETETKDEGKSTVKSDPATDNLSVIIWAGIITLVIVFGGWLIWIRKRKQSANKFIPEKEDIPVSIKEILQLASESLSANDKTFYNNLRQSIWNYFSLRLGLTGSKMNRNYLFALLEQKGINRNNQTALGEILEKCETGVYTDVHSSPDKKVLLEQTISLLEQLDINLR